MKSLEENNEVLPDQKKKPAQKPTLMWIFSLFSAVTMISMPGDEKTRTIVNFHPVHKKVILLLGGIIRKMYLIPDSLELQDIELNQKNWLTWCGI